ncbi:MAG: hypothetical protein HKN94_01645 [Acidimicrobiales bacterium]|nr:hypothetical protein [Acidimicrobiia bacterium]NNC78831.1 hypothetical protein [Acidimicrobiales bacterium]RZV46345.1 MAG: hypothetical protein EX269_07560 [Acidimicrobiales bacterium]
MLRPGGHLAFHTIQPAENLSKSQRRRVSAAGPSAVALRTTYRSLLSSAEFTDIVASDVTSNYRATLQRWTDATQTRQAEMRRVMGEEAYGERLADRSRALQAIDDGLLKRFQYAALRP